jgi:hypothetical protein
LVAERTRARAKRISASSMVTRSTLPMAGAHSPAAPWLISGGAAKLAAVKLNEKISQECCHAAAG